MDSSSDNVDFACSNNQPRLCATGCGFFGTAEMRGFCSKCYKNKHVQQISASVVGDELRLSTPKISGGGGDDLKSTATPMNQSAAVAKKRCDSCNKKLGLLGFLCRCEGSFCNRHRHPEAHECQFDFKKAGKIVVQKQNPLIKADKILDRI